MFIDYEKKNKLHYNEQFEHRGKLALLERILGQTRN